jgi:hypothetical protein
MEMNWSHWFRCESSFGLLLVPAQPGIFALAEEIVQPAGPYSRRMLAVFEVEETDDLARALNRLFTPASAWRQRLAEGRCYLRYAVAPDAEERRGAATALKNWLNSQREVAGQIFDPSSMPAAGEMRSERGMARAEHEGEAAQRCGALEEEAAGEMGSERGMARAEHEGEAAQRCGALEEEEAATVTERAVDRVSKAKEYEKVFPAGF